MEGVIERNPAVKGTAPRVALKERAALTPDQAADLIAAETDDTWRLMWMHSISTKTSYFVHRLLRCRHV